MSLGLCDTKLMSIYGRGHVFSLCATICFYFFQRIAIRTVRSSAFLNTFACLEFVALCVSIEMTLGFVHKINFLV